MSNFTLLKINKAPGSIIDGSYAYFIESELNKRIKDFNENKFDWVKDSLPSDLRDILERIGEDKFQLLCNQKSYDQFSQKDDCFDYFKILQSNDLSADKIKNILINCANEYIRTTAQITNNYKLFLENQFNDFITRYSYTIVLCRGNFTEKPDLIFMNKISNLINLNDIVIDETTSILFFQNQNDNFSLQNGSILLNLFEYKPEVIYSELKYGSISLKDWLIELDEIKSLWLANDEIDNLYTAAIDTGSFHDFKLIFSFLPIVKHNHLVNYLIRCRNENKIEFILYILNCESRGLQDLLNHLNINDVSPLLSLINDKEKFISTLRGVNLKNYTTITLKNKKFLLLKENLKWSISSTDEFDEMNKPKYIGEVCNYGLGELPNTTKLAWKIDPDYQGNGYMKELLSQYIRVITPNAAGFEVIILNDNIPSIKLALSVGFVKTIERDSFSQFLLKK